MSIQAEYLKILSKIIPAGTVSASLLLGSATPSEASLTDVQPSASATLRVSERLGAIREAISDTMIAANIDTSEGATQLSWSNVGWRNWLGRPVLKRDPHPFPHH